METLQALLRGAVESGASDVHLKIGAPVTFRVQRELRTVEAPAPTEAWMESILGNIVPSHLRERLEREREVDFALSLPGVGRFRTNVFQQRGSFVIAMRLVRSVIRSFGELHLPEIIRRLAESPRGIILVAGAPGQGKSTTLATMIEHLNATSRRHIISLEDPIEFAFDDKQSVIEQREVGLDTATFASGLRNVLRQDPDVLVIGEMREMESVSAGVSAANLGALVISTLHTGDVTRSVQRILEFFPGPEREQARRQLAGTLQAIVCQRLVRTPAGGVLPALEILVNTAGVAKLIESDRLDRLQGAMELGGGDGMQTFDQAFYQLVTSGQITAAEALSHAPNPDTLKMRLQGVVLSETRRILNSRD